MPLDVLDVVQLGCQWVLNVDNEDLPVCLTFIEQRHDAKNLDLLDLPDVPDLFANLADIERVIVTLGLGLRMHLRWVLPGLH